MSKSLLRSTRSILSNKHEDHHRREAETLPPDKRNFVDFDYEEQLDEMAVELKLVQSELEAKNKILQENEGVN